MAPFSAEAPPLPASSLLMAFGEPVSFRTYHLTLPLIISRVLSPQQTLSSSRAEPLMSVFPEPATPRERTPKRHSEMRSLEAHSAPFAWLVLLFVWSVREETGSHPEGLPWVKNRPLWDVLAFSRATSLQAVRWLTFSPSMSG